MKIKFSKTTAKPSMTDFYIVLFYDPQTV